MVTAAPSLGASGCVFGVVTYVLMRYSDVKLELLFFIPAQGEHVLWGSLAVNALLMLLVKRVRVDGAAHLGMWPGEREAPLAGWVPRAAPVCAAGTL